ncbi:6-carboxytetrahydropterin synthase [Paraferrimonas sedimenticola]|uniref:6-carboxy-5,6,7,8-tetrahydropterin synthase n=1 Tax=Paraferrimonas sedimenticola TaxID=375674 RepID=A0AA37RZ08_9GAMM|nr:6-carboxytetrahydropterin synthase [Paraferrimonas sedimenticola]GLP97986.1 hypothetical protein GCM10007895_32930 [Paraferrimonas sedimenticola]
MKLFVKDLTVADFSYLCAKRGMVGESWSVDVTLDGALDHQNMVLDFAKVKKIIKQVIDDSVDHRLAVPVNSAGCKVTRRDQQVCVDFATEKGSIHLACPEQAYAMIDTEVISQEAVHAHLHELLLQALPENVQGLELEFHCEAIDGAFYHYSHGLKKHDGNCQRIAHGHRSPVQVYLDGERSDSEEQYWAERWCDIYLGTSEDQVSLEVLTLGEPCSHLVDSHWGFCYQAPQGEFQLAIPKAICDIIPCDTTVELLAGFMARVSSHNHPSSQVRVVAYEGIGKGAIATCHSNE